MNETIRVISQTITKFNFYQSLVRAKLDQKRRHLTGTGGGPPDDTKFSDIEQIYADLLQQFERDLDGIHGAISSTVRMPVLEPKLLFYIQLFMPNYFHVT